MTSRKNVQRTSVAERLKRFDQATARLKRVQKSVPRVEGDRGWTREDLYKRSGRCD